jgi:hypothetical protein
MSTSFQTKLLERPLCEAVEGQKNRHFVCSLMRGSGGSKSNRVMVPRFFLAVSFDGSRIAIRMVDIDKSDFCPIDTFPQKAHNNLVLLFY